MSGKPLTEPLLRPVPGPDGEAKPGVRNFVAETGPTEMAPSSHRALREEDDVWAVEKGGEHSPVRACPRLPWGGFPAPSLLLPCAC